MNHNTHENNNDVNIDYFLYSCYEHEQTLLSLKQEERLRGWDELGSVLESSKEELNLRDLLFNLINWYKGKYPVLLTKKKLNIEELNDITDPLCTLNHDIDTLYEFKCDEKIPPFEASVGNNRIWDHIKEAMTTHFPEHGLLYTRYIEWRHSSEKKMTPEELASRPPVGRFIPKLNAHQRAQNSGYKNKSTRPRNNNNQQRDNNRYKDNNNRNYQNSNKRGHAPSKRRPPKEVDSKLEGLALAEVDKAIESLVKNHKLDEIILKPQNSFYRRLQHQKAVDLGYRSFSVGEGADRSVRIERLVEED